jgi:hypothetical protein
MGYSPKAEGQEDGRCVPAEFPRRSFELVRPERPFLVHLHPWHSRVVHIVMTLIIIVRGPNILRVGLIGVYVDHPAWFLSLLRLF